MSTQFASKTAKLANKAAKLTSKELNLNRRKTQGRTASEKLSNCSGKQRPTRRQWATLLRIHEQWNEEEGARLLLRNARLRETPQAESRGGSRSACSGNGTDKANIIQNYGQLGMLTS
ncbi:hypothetical protein [Peribacillus muralis]|uniref:hypothetical protein n=1 Tax=Peribacillus muralis TaxID=264697 RepID=UPI00366C8C5E